MKGSKAPPIDVDGLVAQLGGGAPAAAAAVASARDLLRSWFQWKAPGASAAARRTLLHIAAHYGSPGALRALLDLGADPNAAADDGATPMHCACHARGDSLAEVLELLLSRGADKELRDALGRRPVDLLLAQTRSGDLDKPEFRTDEFRMFGFKVASCPNDEPHDWTECPYAHPGEKARRRDPRVFTYTGVACPDFRKGVCKRGDECTYGHGVFECWLHPSRYRTQLCKDGTDCRRRVCFFAHEESELRPSDLPPADEKGAASASDDAASDERAASDDGASVASARCGSGGGGGRGLSRASSSCSNSDTASLCAPSPAPAAAEAAAAAAQQADQKPERQQAAPRARKDGGAAAGGRQGRRLSTPASTGASNPSSSCGTPTRGAAAMPTPAPSNSAAVAAMRPPNRAGAGSPSSLLAACHAVGAPAPAAPSLPAVQALPCSTDPPLAPALGLFGSADARGAPPFQAGWPAGGAGLLAGVDAKAAPCAAPALPLGDSPWSVFGAGSSGGGPAAAADQLAGPLSALGLGLLSGAAGLGRARAGLSDGLPDAAIAAWLQQRQQQQQAPHQQLLAVQQAAAAAAAAAVWERQPPPPQPALGLDLHPLALAHLHQEQHHHHHQQQLQQQQQQLLLQQQIQLQLLAAGSAGLPLGLF